MKKEYILITIAGLLLILLGIIFLLNPNIKPNSNENTEEEVLGYDYLSKYSKEMFNEINRYNEILLVEYPIEDLEKISDKLKTAVVITNINEQKDKKTISYEEVKKQSNKYFKNINIIKADIRSNNLLIYKFDNNKFIYNELPYNVFNTYEYSKAFGKVTEDNIEIEQTLYFVTIDTDENNNKKNTIYKDPKLKEKLYEADENLITDNKIENEIKDKLDTYVYHFEKYKNKYILKSVTKKVD